MLNLTKQEYFDLVHQLPVTRDAKDRLLQQADIPNSHIIMRMNANSTHPVFNSQQHLDVRISRIFNEAKENFNVFLKYDLWKQSFLDNLQPIIREGKGQKDDTFTAIYNIFRTSDEISIFEPQYQEKFLLAFRIKALVANASFNELSSMGIINGHDFNGIIYALEDLFKIKEEVGIEFFKEAFCIYLEGISIHPEYKSKLNEINTWALGQDFTEFYNKYRNIRLFKEDLGDEEEFSTLVKKVHIKNHLDITNFNKLHLFLKDKFKVDSNIQDILYVDEKVFAKTLIVHKVRDKYVDSIINMHNVIFFDTTEELSNTKIEKLWNKCLLEIELANKGTNQNSRTITKI